MKELCWNCKGHGKLITNDSISDCWLCDNTGYMVAPLAPVTRRRTMTRAEKQQCDIMEYCNTVSYDIFVKYDSELMQRYENLGKLYSMIAKLN